MVIQFTTRLPFYLYVFLLPEEFPEGFLLSRRQKRYAGREVFFNADGAFPNIP